MNRSIIKSDATIEMVEIRKFDYTSLYKEFRKYWYVFLLSIFATVSIAFLYNRFSKQIYQVSATILFSNESNEFAVANTNVFQGINPFVTNSNFYNEINVLNSYPIIYKAIQNLNFNISYYGYENFVETELYHATPFIVSFPQNMPQPVNLRFKIKFLGNNQYRIKARGKDVQMYSYSENKVVTIIRKIKINDINLFGEDINNENFRFRLVLNNQNDMTEYENEKFTFEFQDLNALTSYYKSQLKLNLISPESTVAGIVFNSPNVNKAIDFLNSLTDEYLRENLAKKNHYAKATAEYINGQMQKIADSLSYTEEKLQNFRKSNQVIDVTAKADRIYTQMQTFETEKASLIIRQKYYVYIKDYFEKNTDVADLIAPSSLGIEDPLLTNLIQNLIQLNAEKNGLIENNQQRSPYLKKLEISIDNLKNTISENINYLLNTIDISIQDVDQRISLLNSELRKLPETERHLLGIERKFNINDAIYTYFLQRNAEAQITMAANLPNTQLVEPPRMVGEGPIIPRKKINYVLGFILGILLPGMFFFTKEAMRDTISSKEELQKLTKVPIIGQIMHKRKNYRNNVVFSMPGSSITESFRILRSNMQFFVKDAPHHSIMVTSTLSGEGKSFCAYNLASILATNNKKAILLAFDMRKPEFYEELGFTNKLGISSLLSRQASIEDVIQNTENSFLQIIPPGPIPPNPSELITSEESKKLIDKLKSIYNYIIIDTPPIGIVSDGMHLIPYADTKIYLVRLNYTPKKILLHALGDFDLRESNNACLLINDYMVDDKQYGYSYRYYHSENKKVTKKELAKT